MSESRRNSSIQQVFDSISTPGKGKERDTRPNEQELKQYGETPEQRRNSTLRLTEKVSDSEVDENPLAVELQAGTDFDATGYLSDKPLDHELFEQEAGSFIQESKSSSPDPIELLDIKIHQHQFNPLEAIQNMLTSYQVEMAKPYRHVSKNHKDAAAIFATNLLRAETAITNINNDLTLPLSEKFYLKADAYYEFLDHLEGSPEYQKVKQSGSFNFKESELHQIIDESKGCLLKGGRLAEICLETAILREQIEAKIGEKTTSAERNEKHRLNIEKRKLQKQISQLEEQKTKLEEDMMAVKDQKHRHSILLKGKDGQSGLQAEKIRLEKENTELSEKILKTDNELEQLKEEKKKVDSEYLALQDTNKKNAEKYDTIFVEKGQLSQRMGELENEIATVKEEKKNSETTNGELVETINKLNRELEGQKAALKRINQKEEIVASTVASSEEDVKAKLADREIENGELQSTLKDALQAQGAAVKEREELKERLKQETLNQEKALREKQDEIEALKRDNQRYLEKVGPLAEEKTAPQKIKRRRKRTNPKTATVISDAAETTKLTSHLVTGEDKNGEKELDNNVMDAEVLVHSDTSEGEEENGSNPQQRIAALEKQNAELKSKLNESEKQLSVFTNVFATLGRILGDTFSQLLGAVVKYDEAADDLEKAIHKRDTIKFKYESADRLQLKDEKRQKLLQKHEKHTQQSKEKSTQKDENLKAMLQQSYAFEKEIHEAISKGQPTPTQKAVTEINKERRSNPNKVAAQSGNSPRTGNQDSPASSQHEDPVEANSTMAWLSQTFSSGKKLLADKTDEAVGAVREVTKNTALNPDRINTSPSSTPPTVPAAKLAQQPAATISAADTPPAKPKSAANGNGRPSQTGLFNKDNNADAKPKPVPATPAPGVADRVLGWLGQK